MKKYFVDYPDIPGNYDCIAVYADNHKNALQEARSTWELMTGKPCHKLPNGTVIRVNDPYADMRAKTRCSDDRLWD